jgi:Fe-S-cluster-containing dehydrogenase component/DMSO reductase anchor subunit
MQKTFILDLNRCTGCHACQIACKIENELAPEMSWRQIVTFNVQRLPAIPLFSLSLACNHCIDAPCKETCPALAYTKDKETGAVTIDPKLCMGCKYCQWICPYDAPKFNEATGVMEKCTFCSHRLSRELEPACTVACPTGALELGDYSAKHGAEKTQIPGFWRQGIEPAIRIKPLRRPTKPPQMASAQTVPDPPPSPNPRSQSKVSLRSEWPLALFTLTTAVLVALFHSWILAKVPVSPVLFGLAGAVAMATSTSHLGRKQRFYRAVLNFKRSWVSREIVFFTVFMGGAIYSLVATPNNAVTVRVVAAVGFVALFSMDKVYQVRTNLSGRSLHSASVLLTGLYLVGVFTANPWYLFPLGVVKLVLYLLRHLFLLRQRTSGWQVVLLARINFGTLLPLLLWLLSGTAHYEIILASILIGEILDRAEFYMELDFTYPAAQARRDLKEMIAHKPLVLT